MRREADVVVIGAGAAGLCAALTAAEHGLSVLLLEKLGAFGGSSILSGGSLCFAGTDIQKRHGVSDSPAQLRADLLAVGDGASNPDVVDTYVNNQAEVYQWLRSHGVAFADSLKHSFGNSVLRTHTADPGLFLPLLEEAAQATGKVELIYGAHVTKLIVEDERVVGAECWSDALSEARAKLGVIVTTGGFTRSPDLIGRFAPDFLAAKKRGGTGNTGDGLLMGMKAGADVVDTAFLQGNYGTHPDGKSNGPTLPVHKGGVAINARGMRYVDESLSNKKLAAPSLAQPGQITYQVFDQTVFDKGDDVNPYYTFAARLSMGDIVKADTLEELAEILGLPAKSLKNTIERYNDGVNEGEDPDFGRTSIVSGKGEMTRIERAPFYAHATTVAMLGTYCGLKTDGTLNVLDVFDEPIEGLYAAGEVLGGFHGRAEVPGAALGKAIIFGRVAAMNIAALSNSEAKKSA